MEVRKMKLFIIIINLLFVTANKLPINVEIIESLLKNWNIQDNESLCQLDVNGKMSGSNHQPLLIHANSTKFFHPTERNGVITMRQYEKIQLFCSTGFSHPANINDNSVSLQCMNNGHIQLNDGERFFNNFSCRKHPIHSARRRISASCYNNSTLVDIGFEIDNKFLITMTICHDVINEQTYYVKYRLTPANVAGQHGIKRPSFIQSSFFPDKDVNLLYSRNHQRKIISEFIESDVLDNSNVYLSRGHLAAKADFIYGNEQRATFYYINTAPQWQSFNNLNWRAIEDAVRRLSADRNISLDVYTGTHDVLSMANSKGDKQALYLDMKNKKIPIPKFFYKIIINRSNVSGIAIVCANNVFATVEEIKNDYIICRDVADSIKYIKWRRKEIRRGYCYACSIDDFLVAVPHLKGIDIQKLLI